MKGADCQFNKHRLVLNQFKKIPSKRNSIIVLIYLRHQHIWVDRIKVFIVRINFCYRTINFEV